ncbi:molybdenum cofactor guanylyltransferase [Paenibacillus mendelii]|uniref:Molybdenum cofactor guanylyltransferase n=1 Tax=Paenibacillus mendelii TaxID=206163 RepID=A0ABV6J672_9BACL|nr:molybdenum cofactor guanylyltransferase [Paenibacillus mendelii]
MLSGIILAGGDNRGMEGKNRALLELGSKTFLERQLSEMRKCCNELIIVTNDPFPFMRVVDREVRIITDFYPGNGAVGGIHAGLALAKNPYIWVVGGHMPFISAAAAQLMLASMADGCNAAIPSVANRVYPLHGLYKKQCCESIERLMDTGSTSIAALLDALQWCEAGENVFQMNQIDCRFVVEVHTLVDYERLVRESEAVNREAQPDISLSSSWT